MIPRQTLLMAWKRHYSVVLPSWGLSRAEVREHAEDNARLCEERMWRLGRERQALHHGYDKRGLNQVTGMALGVHKQLLWGLNPLPPGGYNRGRREG